MFQRMNLCKIWDLGDAYFVVEIHCLDRVVLLVVSDIHTASQLCSGNGVTECWTYFVFEGVVIA